MMETSFSPATDDGLGINDQLHPAAELLCDSSSKPPPLKCAVEECAIESDIQEHSPSLVLPPTSPLSVSHDPSSGHILRSESAASDSVMLNKFASPARQSGSSSRGEGVDQAMDAPPFDDVESNRAMVKARIAAVEASPISASRIASNVERLWKFLAFVNSGF
ncbi:hypothetical protein Nepgr_032655 [Nepenthes gracilis]|uniref:Uncharacterized protein n=1 Tax=Nepenthes gracilis TaxID=150966 RepID=A0AAD3TL93_NEPGR|nr:hypothetical protein Nepgr_032655 [Nepenthes gracilis]